MSSKLLVMFNGEAVSPSDLTARLESGDLTLHLIRSGDFVESEHSATLTVEYDGWTYEEEVYDIDGCDYLDWRGLTGDDLYIKWDHLIISREFGLREYEVDLNDGNFAPPEGVDYKRPDKISISNETWTRPLALGEMLNRDGWEEFADLLEEMGYDIHDLTADEEEEG